MYLYRNKVFVKLTPCTCVISHGGDGHATLKKVFTDAGQWEWLRSDHFFRRYPSDRHELYKFGLKTLKIQIQWAWASGLSTGRGVIVPVAITVTFQVFGKASDVVRYLNKRAEPEEAWAAQYGVTDEAIAELVQRKVYGILHASRQAFYHYPDKKGLHMAQTISNALTSVLSDWGLTLLDVKVTSPPATIIS